MIMRMFSPGSLRSPGAGTCDARFTGLGVLLRALRRFHKEIVEDSERADGVGGYKIAQGSTYGASLSFMGVWDGIRGGGARCCGS